MNDENTKDMNVEATNNEVSESVVIPDEVGIRIDALTTENAKLHELIQAKNENIRTLENALLEKNDVIKIKEEHLKSLGEERDYLRAELDKYEKIKKAKEDCKLSVGVGFIDFDEPMVSLEETLRAVKDAGCNVVSFTFFNDEDVEE